MTAEPVNRLQRLEALDSNILSDVMDAAGLRDQVLTPTLRPLDPAARIVGVALCVRGAGGAAGTPHAPLTPFDIDAALFPGAVVVMDSGGAVDSSLLGGFVARSWQLAGARGMVTDGLVRDSGEIVELGFPVFAAGTTPAASGGRWNLLSVGGSATLGRLGGGRVEIRDGDLILGDRDGVSVVPAAHADAILAAAETLKAIEGRIGAMMTAGKTRREAFAANPRFDHVPRLV